VAGDGPVMGRREGEVSSMLHGRQTVRGGLGRRSPCTNLATAETAGQGCASDTDGSVASDSGGGAVGTGRGEARRGGSDSRSERGRSKRRSAVGTPAHGPDSAFNARAPRGAWQPRSNGALPGGPGADSGV
jgi:hypothetical protein